MSHHDEMLPSREIPVNPQMNHSQYQAKYVRQQGLLTKQSSNHTLNESSDKQTFTSGAESSGNVARYDLISLSLLDRLGERLKLGAVKYGPFQYRKGLKDREFILDRLNHAIRHIRLAQDLIHGGLPFGDDDLAGAVCSIMFAMEYQEANGLLPPNEVK